MFKKVTEDAILPTRGSKYAACVDVYANEDVFIGAGETQVVGLGIAIDEEAMLDGIHSIYTNYGMDAKHKLDYFFKTNYLQLMLRSSLGKKGLILPNGVGVIDLDYRDEIKMVIHNPVDIVTVYSLQENSNPSFIEIKKGDKIGQITLLEHKSYLFGIGTDEERVGGFGSTGER